MNTKNRIFTIMSISFLAVAAATVGVYAYYSLPQVTADVETEPASEFISVRKGWNYFNSGNRIIDLDSRIISINKSLISLKEARERGIISEINLIKDGKILSSGVNKIPAKSDFSLYFKDIGVDPQVYLGEGK